MYSSQLLWTNEPLTIAAFNNNSGDDDDEEDRPEEEEGMNDISELYHAWIEWFYAVWLLGDSNDTSSETILKKLKRCMYTSQFIPYHVVLLLARNATPRIRLRMLKDIAELGSCVMGFRHLALGREEPCEFRSPDDLNTDHLGFENLVLKIRRDLRDRPPK